jgi:alkylation response protein AidB-like acyl-CoA dehydrogenase
MTHQTSQAPSDGQQTVHYDEARQVAEAARETEWRKPSFAKELFLGRFDINLISPHPRSAPESVAKGEAFLEQLRAFLTEEVNPMQIERDAKIPEAVIKGLGELGAFGMKIPEEYGGLGLTQVYYNRALELAGSWSATLVALLSAHQSIGVPQPLKQFGTPEQKKKYLPRVAKDAVSAFLLTEPDVGSDAARVGTMAIPTEDGSAYILNGTKLWATNGAIAELLVVMAKVPKSPGHRGGITAFIVEADSPGVVVENRNAFMGLRGIENSVTSFTDVRVPAENLLWEEGRGLRIALTTLNTGRLSLPAGCASAAKLSLKYAREWSSQRIQWGMPVGKHDAVAQKVAFIAATTFALEAVVELSSQMADEDRNDIRIEGALAKLYCSEMAWTIVDEMIQVRGGRGYETAESLAARGEKPVPAEQMLRDMRINRIFEGSSEIMKLLIAREAVDQHLSIAGDIIDKNVKLADKAKTAIKAGQFYAGWLPTLAVGAGQNPRSYAEFGALAEHLRFVERNSRKLARSTFYGMSRWQAKLEQKQHWLGRIVDIGCELFAMSASVVRAEMLAKDDPANADAVRELAAMFCAQAQLRVDALFTALWSNEDKKNYAFAGKVLAGRYQFAEEGILDPSGDGPTIAAIDQKPPRLGAEALPATGV